MNSTLRLTRRGRLVVITVLAALLCLAFLAGRSGTSIAATDAPRTYASTTVQPGETLWSVAKRVAPGHDPRATVEQILELNHLTGGTVLVGQQLLLPHSS
jgi:LysM repeat protein